MRWISSSSSDVISFYSLPDGVQHVLPALFEVRQVEASQCTTPPKSARTSVAQISTDIQQQEKLQCACMGSRRDSSSNAGIEHKGQQTRSACVGSSALPSAVLPSEPSSRNYFHASRQSPQVQGEPSVKDSLYSHCSKSYHTAVIVPQPSLGYITTCIFSGGWGGYDETEVTLGTTEGYVYALPALWPPPAPGAYEETPLRGEGGSLTICQSCGAPAVAIPRAAVDAGKSAALLCAACKAAVGDGGTASDGGAPRDDQLEETSSLAFPTSYVATPVKRFARLPYTVQHLQMIGAHTPALAGEYHDELLWLQQEHRRQRTPAPWVYGLERHGFNQSETEDPRSCTRSNSRQHEVCESSSCLDHVSCCCGRRPLLSTCTHSQCCSFPPSNCSASSSRSFSSLSASAALPAPTSASPRSKHLASRVQQFFSSDRLLLALDKGGNGIVAHWPAPSYLQDWLPATPASTSGGWAAGATSVPDYKHFSRAPATPAPAPLAGSFSLNLSLQCCASNPVITPLLAVVPCVVAAGGLRLLSVYDLVTSSFVFYARPPLLPSRLAHVHAGQRQHHRHSPQRASVDGAWLRRGSPSQQIGLVWSNMCCLSRSPGIVADGTQPGGCPSGPCLARRYDAGATGHGLPAVSSAATGRNLPISVSSLAWLPALHPLLLGASTDSGLLLLYDLRASPHPVFCATRPPSAGADRSDMVSACCRNERTHTASSHCFHVGARETCESRQAVTAAASSEMSPIAVEAASTGGAYSPVAAESSLKAPSFKCIGKKPVAGRMEDRRSNGKENELACEEKRVIRQVRRNSSRCGGEKDRKRYSEKRHKSGKKPGEDKSTSISFLGTPAWLTSAAISHDAAILPCGCRCCQARAAEFSKAEAPSCVQSAISTALPLTKRHRQDLIQGDSVTLLQAKTESALKRQSSRSCEPTANDHQYKALSYTHDQKQVDKAAEADVTDKGDVTFFEGCAATVVIKPRNSTRPRPRLRKRVGAKRESFDHASRRGKTGTQRFGCDRSAESTPPGRHWSSSKLPNDGFFCTGALDDAGSAAAFTQHYEGGIGDARRRKRRTSRQRHDASWRRRWFARQERALVTFFSEAYTTLLSERLRKGDTAAAASAEVDTLTPSRAADTSSFASSDQRCTSHSSVRGATESTQCRSNPLINSAASGSRGRKRNLEVMWSSDGVPSSSSSSSSSSMLLGDVDVQATRSEDLGAISAVSCGSCAVAPRQRGRPLHSRQRSEVSSCSLLMSSCYVPSVTITSTELPFYLLRLASSPCSVLTGFPSTRGSSRQKTFPRSSCRLAGQPLRLFNISVPFIASCFFSLFARLLYTHRLDQHVVARRLAYHEERQILKLLHAADCSESARVSTGLSAVDAAITAVDAAAAAAAEANSAELDAQAAGVAVAKPTGAAAVASDLVEPDASKKTDLWMPPSPLRVPGRRNTGARSEESNDAVAVKLATGQDVSVFSPCAASSDILSSAVPTSATCEARVAPEKRSSLLWNFEKKLLSLYANVLLVDRRDRAAQRTTPMPSLRDSIERGLPDMFSRHAQNCMQLLRYAAAVLYAFGDAAPVLTKKSAAAQKAVQAAAACAVGLESEKSLSSLFSPASAACPGLCTGAQGAHVSSPYCAAARGVRLATSMREKTGTQQASGEGKRTDEKQLRCGCGRAEAAVKAKVRRWLAEEFLTEARLAMRDTLMESSASLTGREKTDVSAVTWEKGPRLEETDCGTAGVEQVVAATRLVAFSMCLCELFQSATFFPILFFNVFRRLFDRVSEVPLCIQRNCIRALPVSDMIYQRLARSQLRTLTRSLCETQRSFPIQSVVRQTECPAIDVSGVPFGKVCAATSSMSCSQSTWCGTCRHATRLADRTDTAKYASGSDRHSHERIGGESKDQKRTQQLFCLDERGRVRVLSISLRLVVDRSSQHGGGGHGWVKSPSSNACDVTNADKSRDLGFASRWNRERQREAIDDSLSRQQGGTVFKHTPAFPGTVVQSTRDKRAQNGDIIDECKDIHVQQSDPAGCSSSQLAFSNDKTSVITPEQKSSERPSRLQHVKPSLSFVNSSMLERSLWGSGGSKELLPVDKDEQEYFCLSEPESGNQNCCLQRKMWKAQWLRRRRRSEWCGACMPIRIGTFCAATSGYIFSDNIKTSVNFEDPKGTSLSDSVLRSSSPASQARISKRADDVLTAEAGDICEGSKKARLGQGRTPVAARGMGRARRGGKHSFRLLNEVERLAITERVARTAATTRLAQINANISLLRLFPLLPLWNSLKPRHLWRMSSKLHRGRCALGSSPFGLSRTKTYSCDSHSGSQRRIGSGSARASETEQSCEAPSSFPAAGGLSDVLTSAAGLTCSASKGASVAQRLDLADKSKEEGRRLACPAGPQGETETSTGGRSEEEEECSEYCRHVCCRLQVEEEACFEINGKNTYGHLESDSRRSRVMSLAIHENGRYVLAATCAPSFLLYSTSRMDPLPPYERGDRLLFGCATGTIAPSRVFPLLSACHGAHVSPAGSVGRSRQNVPSFFLPDAPPGPRPPPPVLISASPILPPTAAAPFLPHTLLRRHVDHDVAYGLTYNRSASMRRLARSRSRMSASMRSQNVYAVYGPGGTRGQAVFSDWLTDEEDEREMHGGTSGSETKSVSDT